MVAQEEATGLILCHNPSSGGLTVEIESGKKT